MTNKRHFGAIPNFSLAPYGEETLWDIPEPMHYDELVNKSEAFQWNIAAHRHTSLYQLFVLTKGMVAVSIDGRETNCRAPAIIFVPPMTVHGFKYQEGSDGHVLTILETAFKPILLNSPDLAAKFKTPFLISKQSATARFGELDACFRQLADEFSASRPGRLQILHALTLQILVSALRIANTSPASESGQGQVHSDDDIAALFVELVDKHFTEHPENGFFATLLGVSEAKLIRVSNRILGQSPQQVTKNRIILEAKRSLIYTGLSCAQVGHSLGFDDPAYFSRFFKSNTGMTPVQFRKDAVQ